VIQAQATQKNQRTIMLSAMQFFWDRNSKSEDRTRFNLLTLEYGEVFVEDFSVYAFPPFTEDATDFSAIEPLKVRGRLKMCSRSLIFEPLDPSRPLLKYSFKQMTTGVDIYRLGTRDEELCSFKSTSFVAFACNCYSEIKEHGRVGPHRVIKCGGTGFKGANQQVFLFALLHADAPQFVSKVIELRRLLNYQRGLISTIDQLGGPSLAPTLNARSVFDTSSLVDFHETLLLKQPVAVKRIKPLLAIPGVLMATEQRLYYQPAQLNNVSEKFQYIDLNRVERILRRRYLLQPLGLEFLMLDGSAIFFVFDNSTERDRIYGVVAANCPAQTHSTMESVEAATRRWQRREISNFDYLMLLNREADRSPNDLTQYQYSHT
jgi:factor associated with neutral sphingomyelinase activation